MQCRRRHCFARIVGSLAALLFVVVVVVVIRLNYWQSRQNGAVTTIKKTDQDPYKVLRQRNTAEPPSPPGYLANGSLVQARPASGTSNRSLAEEENAESVRRVEPYRYILNEPHKCRRNGTFLLLLIPVEPHNAGARNAIRQTWGNESLSEGIVRLFLTGVKNRFDDDVLAQESARHRDIIQQDYVDSYYNLTIKTLMGMHWASKYCPNAKYVMKADSDMFVNTEYLVHKLLKSDIPREMYFTGYLMRGYKPNRDKQSKWYMSSELYPSESYPTFCSGTGYVFSTDMARRIYNTSLSIRRLHLEDVYVGLCLAKLNIQPTLPPNEFLFNHWKVSYSSCKYSQLITSHEFRPNELLKYWQHLQTNKNNACKSAKG